MHDFKNAIKVTIILGNLNVPTKRALYVRFASEYCCEILCRCEFIYTPVHGSWLNIAESELSVLTRQCTDRHIGTLEAYRQSVQAWTTYHNSKSKGVNWQFTAEDARIKLTSVYPVFQFEKNNYKFSQHAVLVLTQH